MIARISTLMNASSKRFWQDIDKPASLIYVSAPLLAFSAEDDEMFSSPWKLDVTYDLTLRLFSFIPLGKHHIKVIALYRENNEIRSQESGSLAKVWNHRIVFSDNGINQISYTDEIEIHAGLLTPFIWAFAQIFYRHRQRRWKKLLKSKNLPQI